ncbi:diacylglycerol kinase [Cryobacterium sp. TMT2-10]|uniref:Diacylglycerol kinase n=1 Tax=Cryobacterium shii TaxID=1259235 RepID=A0AAQ2C933_9MICO|nr:MULTISPECIES: diacylglycerol kinase family protein [Cryobacterium]TFC52918.1 diacylglycerol kinase [Cryobacterium shii]TFD18834.1 diacylglycerol kinase [Cryobacterium sp. TMT4-10]TFD43192.1 diacylglycerol kinase [Cryobacterium sp. TMT2-10]
MTTTDLHNDAPTESATDSLLAAVIYNPVKVNLDDLKAAVAAEQTAAGWPETLWFETSEEDPGQGPARKAIEARASVIIVAGGDGTVRAVAEEVAGTECALALLPSGTGNLLARNLKLTLDDAAHSLHTAFTGKDKAIDVCRIKIERADRSVDKHVYLVMAGLGLDAKMLANTDDGLKAKAGWLAYVKALVAVGKDDSELNFRYRLDGKPEQSLRAHTVMIGNCGSLPASIELIPDAALDDGAFDVVVMKPKGLGGWIQILSKVLWENGVLSRTALGRKLRTGDVDALNYATGKELILRLHRPEEIELDGDGYGTAVALKTWVEPGSLTVRVPSDAE